MLCEYTTSLIIPLVMIAVATVTIDGIAMILLVGGVYALGLSVIIYVVGVNGMHAEYTWYCYGIHYTHTTTHATVLVTVYRYMYTTTRCSYV